MPEFTPAPELPRRTRAHDERLLRLGGDEVVLGFDDGDSGDPGNSAG
ncbi:hypothetical protein [Actinorugispora endophytica]|nr:hypothetical protein [Actinorugispora endophytica]